MPVINVSDGWMRECGMVVIFSGLWRQDARGRVMMILTLIFWRIVVFYSDYCHDYLPFFSGNVLLFRWDCQDDLMLYLDDYWGILIDTGFEYLANYPLKLNYNYIIYQRQSFFHHNQIISIKIINVIKYYLLLIDLFKQFYFKTKKCFKKPIFL